MVIGHNITWGSISAVGINGCWNDTSTKSIAKFWDHQLLSSEASVHSTEENGFIHRLAHGLKVWIGYYRQQELLGDQKIASIYVWYSYQILGRLIFFTDNENISNVYRIGSISGGVGMFKSHMCFVSLDLALGEFSE